MNRTGSANLLVAPKLPPQGERSSVSQASSRPCRRPRLRAWAATSNGGREQCLPGLVWLFCLLFFAALVLNTYAIPNRQVIVYCAQDQLYAEPIFKDFEKESGIRVLKNDAVLAMTGYRPDFDFLGSLGVKIEGENRCPKCDPQSLESNVPGIYLAGVIVAGSRTNEIFIENGRFHGRQIAAALAARANTPLV